MNKVLMTILVLLYNFSLFALTSYIVVNYNWSLWAFFIPLCFVVGMRVDKEDDTKN